MDVAKAAAGLLEAPLRPEAYHDGEALPVSRIPFLVAPTTAGTGSEATYVSVLANAGAGVKKSIRHPSHMARVVFLDPELLSGTPSHVLAWSGMDAFTQAIEAYTSVGATGFSDALALEAVRLIHQGLPLVYLGEGGRAAEQLLLGSYMAGLALSHARLGVVHGLAHPLGCRYHVAHGHACASLLPAALEFNRDAMDSKYQIMSDAVSEDLLELVHRWMGEMKIESPFAGEVIHDREGIIRETLASGSTAANPRPVDEADVEALLDAIFA
jgi:alcohol dehydrogenase class IV